MPQADPFKFTETVSGPAWYDRPIVPVGEAIPEPKSTQSPTAQIGIGTAKGAATAVGGFTTPKNVAILGAMIKAQEIPYVGEAIDIGAGAYFTYEMAKNLVESAPQIKKAVEEKNWGGLGKLIGADIVDTAAIFTGGKHTIKRILRRPTVAPTVKATEVKPGEIEPLLPKKKIPLKEGQFEEIQWPPPEKSLVKRTVEHFVGVSEKQKLRDMAKNTLRSNIARGQREYSIAEAAVTPDYLRLQDKPKEYNWQITDDIEAQETDPKHKQTDPANQHVADLLEAIMHAEWDRVIDLKIPGLDRHFYEHYATHIVKDPEGAERYTQDWYNKKSLSGSEAFRKGRKHPTFKDLRKAGFEMVTDNPAELMLLKLQELKKFRVANESIQEWGNRGFPIFKPLTETRKVMRNGVLKKEKVATRMPDGYKAVNDKLFRVGPRGVQGDIILPEPIARVVETYLSPGLRQWIETKPKAIASVGGPIVDAVKNYNAITNIANVAFSGFHALLESGVSMVNDVALSAKYGLAGKPVSSAKALMSSFGWSPIRDFMKGGEIIRQYAHPGEHPELEPLLTAMTEGGFQVRTSPLLRDDFSYRSRLFDRFFDEWESHTPQGVRSIPRSTRYLFNFIMQEWVPRLKAAAAYRLAEFEMDKLGANATIDQQRNAMAKIIDNIDDRHGQMIPDNLMWDKTLKDIGYMSLHFLQWTFGSARAAAGGALDIARQPARMLLGEKPELTHRAAWLITMPFAYGMYNAIYQYMLTGKPPDDMKDLVFPKNGRVRSDGTPERDANPLSGYLRVYYNWTHQPMKSIEDARSNALIGLWDVFIKNADMFNRQIRDPEKGIPTEAWQTIRYLLERGEPISANILLRGKPLSETTRRDVGRAFTGIRTAPVYAMRTAAQNLIIEEGGKRGSRGPIDPEQFDQRTESTRLTTGLLTKELTEDAVEKSFEAGKITARDRNKIFRQSHINPWSPQGMWGRTFMQLQPHEALRIWEAANLDEKQILRPMMSRQLSHLHSIPNAVDREAIRKKILAALQEGRGTPPPGVR